MEETTKTQAAEDFIRQYIKETCGTVPSLLIIAHNADCSASTARNARHNLERRGLLKHHNASYGHNFYTVSDAVLTLGPGWNNGEES